MADTNDRIFEDIEKSADYHPPSVYDALTYYSSFEDQTDSLSLDFIPISQTKANPKLFVVGVLPPSANVTGRLLDRSASIPLTVSLAQAEAAKAPAGAPATVGQPPAKAGTYAGDLPDSFWVRYVQMAQRLKVNPYDLGAVINRESGFKSSVDNPLSSAKGLNQFTYNTFANVVRSMQPGASDADVKAKWDAYGTLSAEQQLPYVEEYFKNANAAKKTPGQLYKYNIGGFHNPDGSLYASLDAQNAYLQSQGLDPTQANRKQYFSRSDYQDLAAKQNKIVVGPDGRITQGTLDTFIAGGYSDLVRSKIDTASRTAGTNPPPKPVVASTTPAETPVDFQGNGSSNASKSKQEVSKTQGRDLNTTELGKRFQAAQKAEINATILAMEAMQNTPPLRFLVNPESFKVSSEKIVSDGNWTRNGPVIEHWGEAQDKIDFSGKVAAFMAIDANSPRSENGNGGSPGLTRIVRSYSASYQNFLSLWMLYRNNGALFTRGLDQVSGQDQLQARLSMVGSMYIYYDGILYIGSFDNFNVTENETGPHTLEYSIQFTVRATFLLDQPPDPREGAYGAQGKNLFSVPTALSVSSGSTSTVSDQSVLLESANRLGNR